MSERAFIIERLIEKAATLGKRATTTGEFFLGTISDEKIVAEIDRLRAQKDALAPRAPKLSNVWLNTGDDRGALEATVTIFPPEEFSPNRILEIRDTKRQIERLQTYQEKRRARTMF